LFPIHFEALALCPRGMQSFRGVARLWPHTDTTPTR